MTNLKHQTKIFRRHSITDVSVGVPVLGFSAHTTVTTVTRLTEQNGLDQLAAVTRPLFEAQYDCDNEQQCLQVFQTVSVSQQRGITLLSVVVVSPSVGYTVS